MKRYCLPFVLTLCCVGCIEAPSSQTPQAPPNVEFLTFGAEWCGPCKTQKPIVDRLKMEFPHVTFRTIDIDKEPTVAASFRVQAVPTMLILVNDRETNRYVGTETQANLAAALDRVAPRPAKKNGR